jgi:hypothetical protein
VFIRASREVPYRVPFQSQTSGTCSRCHNGFDEAPRPSVVDGSDISQKVAKLKRKSNLIGWKSYVSLQSSCRVAKCRSSVGTSQAAKGTFRLRRTIRLYLQPTTQTRLKHSELKQTELPKHLSFRGAQCNGLAWPK